MAHFDFFKGKNLLSIDFGTKVIGLAQFKVGSDPFPTIFGKIYFKDEEHFFSDIKKIVEDEAIDILVMGLPLYTDGKESLATSRIKILSKELYKRVGIPLYLQDETLTTFEAEERMKNSPRYGFKVKLESIDEVSALIILEDFMNSEGLNLTS